MTETIRGPIVDVRAKRGGDPAQGVQAEAQATDRTMPAALASCSSWGRANDGGIEMNRHEPDVHVVTGAASPPGVDEAAGSNADRVPEVAMPAVIGPWIELPLPDPTDWHPMVGELHLLDSQPKAVRLQGILSAWRAAEHTLDSATPGSPAWSAAQDTFVELREAYLRIVDEPSRR